MIPGPGRPHVPAEQSLYPDSEPVLRSALLRGEKPLEMRSLGTTAGESSTAAAGQAQPETND